MILSARLSPRNSIVFIMDPDAGRLPESLTGVVTSTESCLAIGTLCEIDCATTVSISDDPAAVPSGHSLAFKGTIETPNLRLCGCLAPRGTFWEVGTRSTTTAVEVWLNDPSEPDSIIILLTGHAAPPAR